MGKLYRRVMASRPQNPSTKNDRNILEIKQEKDILICNIDMEDQEEYVLQDVTQIVTDEASARRSVTVQNHLATFLREYNENSLINNLTKQR